MACAAPSGPLAQSPETERQKIIVEMFEMLDHKQVILNVADTFADQIGSAIKRKNPDVTKAILDEVTAILRKEFAAMRPDLMLFAGKFMTENFTLDELGQMLAFYKTPVGRKSIRALPKMSQQMVSWLPKIIGKFQTEAITRIKELADKNGIKL